MSIYSGLPTRKDETNYNKLLLKLLTTMQEHILDLTNCIIDGKWARKYAGIIGRMEGFEEHKYLPPKYSQFLTPMMMAMKGSKIKYTSMNLEEVKEQDETTHRMIEKIQSREKLSLKKNKTQISRKSQQFIRNNPDRSFSVFSEQKKSDKQIKWRRTVQDMQLKENQQKKINFPPKSIHHKQPYTRPKVRTAANIGENPHFFDLSHRLKNRKNKVHTEEGVRLHDI